MKRTFGAALLVAVVLPCTLFAEMKSFQPGKIVAVEKGTAASSPAGGTDAPLAPNRRTYNVTVRVNTTLYVCRLETQGTDLDWTEGQKVAVRVSGKVLVIKITGATVNLPILNTRSAD
jgi:hypothetical protein